MNFAGPSRIGAAHVRDTLCNHEQKARHTFFGFLPRQKKHPFLTGIEFAQGELEQTVFESGKIGQHLFETASWKNAKLDVGRGLGKIRIVLTESAPEKIGCEKKADDVLAPVVERFR